jgi:hypothetical protein
MDDFENNWSMVTVKQYRCDGKHFSTLTAMRSYRDSANQKMQKEQPEKYWESQSVHGSRLTITTMSGVLEEYVK